MAPGHRFVDGALTFVLGMLVGVLATLSSISGRLATVETKVDNLTRQFEYQQQHEPRRPTSWRPPRAAVVADGGSAP